MLTNAVMIFALCLQALGIALKLTFEGDNQFVYPQIYFCLLVSHEICLCVVSAIAIGKLPISSETL